MKENTNEQKRKFNAMLLSTNREGMANVIDKQEEQGFFMAPGAKGSGTFAPQVSECRGLGRVSEH